MNSKKLVRSSLAVAIASAALVGCSSPTDTTTQTSSAYSSEALDARTASLNAREAELARREAELNAYNSANTNTPSSQTHFAASGDLLPPGGKTGECYARVWVEPTYRNFEKKILVKEASSRVEVTPAVYETVEETVLVSAASSRLETIPATYRTVNEERLVSAGGQAWKVSLDRHAAPASDELLSAAKRHGIDLDSASPGMCFHEHFLPAQYETIQEQVLVEEAYDTVSIQDAQYRMVDKTVLVSEASTRIEEVPAVYRTETEQVVDVPAHTIWKQGTGPIQRIDAATGEIMCLVEVPATYKTISKRVLASPATTRVVEIPAQYKTIKVRELVSEAQELRNTIPAKYKNVSSQRRVSDPSFVWHEISDTTMSKESRTGNKICLTEEAPRYQTVSRQEVATEATTRRIDIPAEYKTVTVQKLVSPAKETTIVIPEEYDYVSLQEIDKDGFMEWRSILCETNMDRATITSIQRSLKDKGYEPGPIDGVIGQATLSAVQSFQRDNDLPVDKYLNMETIRALGVNIK